MPHQPIIAKPVVKDQFWILVTDHDKVGQIEFSNNQFVVKLRDNTQTFNNVKTIQTRTGIQFNTDIVSVPTDNDRLVHGFPTSCRAYNPMFDVSRRLPMFTKFKKSKSWYAAGYYKIKQDKEWETFFCPKIILLHRYPYLGPFTSIDHNDHTYVTHR